MLADLQLQYSCMSIITPKFVSGIVTNLNIRKDARCQCRIILIACFRFSYSSLKVRPCDLWVLKVLAADAVVVGIDSQPLIRVSIDESLLLIRARLGIAQTIAVAWTVYDVLDMTGGVYDVLDMTGAVGRRVACGVEMHELVHKYGSERAHIIAYFVAEVGAFDIGGGSREC